MDNYFESIVRDPRLDVAQSGCAERSGDGADQQR
jgi:hypothetical protein